ncbi:hypothetical protein I5M27_02915 [Adhaeribacter sp. BT258]|uniref:Deoxynucleoside kinase domain-containing protein n=1 Tax=Adhaeribacter terrigena TaxID=2793070 RepID=A0ABS1BXT6_9BACT|nr:hypothetical protein [Adhaeribacter terrigena]MBK0401919.1 hypothetical protein [Adhaeribacter terrigena]
MKTFTAAPTSKPTRTQQKATIVEFVGSPGVGKTTSCNCFAEMLQAKGLQVCQSEDLKTYFRNLGRRQKLQLYLNTLFLKAFTLVQYTATLARYRIYSLNSVYRFLRLSVFQAALDKMLKSREVNLVLLDQWMIQELWSATIFKTDRVEKLQTELKQFYFKTDYLFYFDLDVETAADRIENRSTNRSRFDRMTPEKRLAEMKKYNAYLHGLYQHADCRQKHTLSTKQSPSQNGELFLKLLAPVLPFN